MTDKCCNECVLWKKRYNSIYKNYVQPKKVKNNHYIDQDINLNLLFKYPDNDETSINRKVIFSKNVLDNIKDNYYMFEYKKYPEDKNININRIYTNVNTYNENKFLLNIKIILEWFDLYNCFLEEKKINESLLFEDFVNYNKKQFKYIEKTYNFKYKVYRCYTFVSEISSIIHDYKKNDILHKILIRCNITYGKLYKLKKKDIKNLTFFIIEKYKLEKELHEIKNINIINHNMNNFPSNIKNQIILRYPGNKYKILKKYINTFDFNNKDCFIDLFGGSLTTSLIVRNMFKDMEIIAFEKNTYLLNFYENLKNNPHSLILKIKECILKLNNIINIEEKTNFIKDNILQLFNNNKYDTLTSASWFFVFNRISFTHITYSKTGNIVVDIDKRINNITIDENKLKNFSNFLNTIILIKYDFIKEGYDIINKYINTKSLIYLDPPYINENKVYRNYGMLFNIEHHDDLLILINSLTKKGIPCIMSNNNDNYVKHLYKHYHIKEIDLISTKHNKIRKEVLIYNYIIK